MVLLKQNKYKEDTFLILREINIEIFKVSILSYLFFVILDSIIPGFVKGFFNLDIILYISVISGITTMLFNFDIIERKNVDIRLSDYILIILFGLGSMVFTYFKIKLISSDFAILVSIMTGLIIIIISYLIINNEIE